MVEESQSMKEYNFLGKVIVQMKDGKPLHRAKILNARHVGRSHGHIPEFDLHIIRDVDGKESTIKSSKLFTCIRAGTVEWEVKGE